MLVHQFERSDDSGNRVKAYAHVSTEQAYAAEILLLNSLAVPVDRNAPRNKVAHTERHSKTFGWYAIACNEPTNDFMQSVSTPFAIEGFGSDYSWMMAQRYPLETDEASEAVLDGLFGQGKELINRHSPGTPISATAGIFRSVVTNRLRRIRQTHVSLGNAGTGMAFVVRDGEVLEDATLRPQGFYEVPGWNWTMGENYLLNVTSAPLQKGDRVFMLSPSIARNSDAIEQVCQYSGIKDPRELSEALFDNDPRIYEKVGYVATM